jgi:hypothetical protein
VRNLQGPGTVKRQNCAFDTFLRKTRHRLLHSADEINTNDRRPVGLGSEMIQQQIEIFPRTNYADLWLIADYLWLRAKQRPEAFLLEMPVVGENVVEPFAAHRLH